MIEHRTFDGRIRLVEYRPRVLERAKRESVVCSRGDAGTSQLFRRPRGPHMKGASMTHRTAIRDADLDLHALEPDAESDRDTPLGMETHEVHYLDMSGDGLPDA